MNKIQTEIQDVWFGRVKLWKVFWLHTSVIGTILSLIIDFLFFSGQFLLSIAFLAVYTIFVIWISKGLYACRFNVKNPEGLRPKFTIVFIVLNLFLFVVSLPKFFSQMEAFRNDPEGFQKAIEDAKTKKPLNS
jgi:hypothetical protein